MDECIVIHQLKSGSQLAFANIYQKYALQAYSLAFKYLCNKSLAEDVVQNLFMKIWLKREEIDPDRPFNHYLFTILKNDILNCLRDSKSNIFVLEDCLEMLNKIYDQESDSQDEYYEQSEILNKAVTKLSQQRREILKLKLEGKYSNQEIADQLGLSVNTIKFQYSQSLKKLKELVRTLSIMILLMS